MAKGSCMCGAIQIELTKEPLGTILCHCSPCRKNAGANGSTNLLVDPEHFRMTGKVNKWTRKGASGQDVVYDYCATCPTIIVVRPAVLGGQLIVKIGLLDEGTDIEKWGPMTELFASNRVVSWCEPTSGIDSKETQ
ncbi:Mss4-like protein [Xylariaceae sp. FL1272]|nr:Mss4-like protein [Xylariaceae sp. FL1272]